MKKTNDKKSLKFDTILGVRLNSTPKEELLKQVVQKLQKKIQFYIVTPNPEIILQAQNDPKLSHSLNSADFSIPDGVGLRYVGSGAGDGIASVIKGREFMIDLFKIANTEKLKVYFLGAKKEVNEKALAKIKTEYTEINAKGNSGPWLDNTANPISEVDSNIEKDIVKEINNFKPELLFIAFGAPKQEIWINNWLPKLNITGAMVVGGSLDYYAGFVKPVPKFFENLNLEWLWRLIQDPRRIGRVVNATIIFPIVVLTHKMGIDKIFHT